LSGYLGGFIKRDVRSGWILLGYIVAVFVGGALVAPWLFYLADALGRYFPQLQLLAGHPFHRYVNRGILFLTFSSLWALASWLRMRSWAALGLVRPPSSARGIAAGLAIGLGALALAAGAHFAAGARDWNWTRTAGGALGCLLRAGLAGAWVSVVEEIVFRGLLFGGLRQALPWPAALTLSSLFYSLVHFFARPASPAEVDWMSGLTTLGEMLQGWFDGRNLLPTAASLFLTGLVFGFAYHRTGSLAFPIGLHAGWVVGLKLYAYLTCAAPVADSRFWGSGKLLDGWWMFAVVGALFLVWVRCWRRPVRPAEAVAWEPDAEAG
jgi:uncharacterized protein